MSHPTRHVRVHTQIASDSTSDLPQILENSTSTAVYTRIVPENTPDLQKILENTPIPTIAQRYDILSFDWKNNMRLLNLLIYIKNEIVNVNQNIVFQFAFLHLPPPSSLGNFSTSSLAPSAASSAAPSIHYFASPSGQAIVHMVDNAMDITHDFFVHQAPRAPSPFDTVMSEPDPTPAPVAARGDLLRENLQKAERWLTLNPPLSPGKYNRYQEKIVTNLFTVVPVFCAITFNSRALTIIMGVAERHGVVMMASMSTQNLSRRLSDSTTLVTLCFERVTKEHNHQLLKDLNRGQTFRTLPRQSGKIEDCTSFFLSTSAFGSLSPRYYRNVTGSAFPMRIGTHPRPP